MQSFKLSLNEDNLPKIRKQIQEYQAEQYIQQKTIKLLKEFDKYYLTFITHRKIRDAVILKTFYEILLHQTCLDEKIAKQFKLTELSKCCINDNSNKSNEILPIDQKEDVMHIEKCIEILKTYYYFFQKKMSKNSVIKEYMADIKAKIEKIKNIDDFSFIERLTKSQSLEKEILAKLEPLKTYKAIEINTILLEKINSNF
jgi:hypothetical protein